MSFAIWKPADAPPERAGMYLVGNKDYKRVGQARYMPKKKIWKFPSASMEFPVQAWDYMPVIYLDST